MLATSCSAPTAADPCLFKGRVGGELVFILNYVYDLLIAASTKAGLDGGKAVISGRFTARGLGVPSYFLSLHIDRCGVTGGIRLGQRQHAVILFERFGLKTANPAHDLMGAGCRLEAAGELLAPALTLTCQELIGALLHLVNAK